MNISDILEQHNEKSGIDWDKFIKKVAEQVTPEQVTPEEVRAYAEGYLEGVEAGFELMKSKKLLNSVYGCFAQNPIMDELNLDFEPLRHITLKETREQKEEILNEYYNRRSSFLHYPIARLLLYEFITLIVYDQVLYCDTDSIFYISSPEIEARIEARNKEKEKKAGA